MSILMYYVYFNQTGNFNSPVIEYEFVTNSQQVKNIFFENNEIKQDVVNGTEDQNIVDYVFMIFYSSLLFFTFKKLISSEKKKFYYIGIILSAVALTSDIIENIQLFHISDLMVNRNDFSNHLTILFYITRIKWVSLAIIFFILSFHYYKYKFIGKLFALISILPLLNILTFIILSDSDINIYLTFANLIMLDFVILMIWIFIRHKNSKSELSFYNN